MLTEEKSVLTNLRRGESKAFEFIFKRYYTILCAYAHKIVPVEIAEGIVQETFLWIWENRENLIIETSLEAYLFKSVYRRALNKLTQMDAIQRANIGFYEEMHGLLQDTDFCQIKELTLQIKEAINALPDSYREAFIMHRFHNMSHKEIAEVLGVSPQTVNYRIQQALKQLRFDLKEYLPILFPLFFPTLYK